MTEPEIWNQRGGAIPWGIAVWSELVKVWTGGKDGQPFSRILHILEVIVLMGGALGPPLIAYWQRDDTGAMSMPVSRGVYEFLVIGLLVLFWVSWCEGGYQLGRQMGTIAKISGPRRLTLELWTGVLFSLLLSFLTSLSTLLPLLAVFLIFAGIESLKAWRLKQTLWVSVLRGFRGSFRRVSQDPLRFLILLAVPGLLLYLINLLLRICQIHFRDLLIAQNPSESAWIVVIWVVVFGILILALGLLGIGLFFIARMDLAIHYLRIQRKQTSDPFRRLDTLLNRVRKYSQGLTALILSAVLLFGLHELVNSDLFGRNPFYSALEACVGVINGFVQKLIDLLAKFSFIVVVITLILGLCLLLVSLASGNGKGILGRLLTFLAERLKGLSNFISKQISLPGQAIQVTTLLSAVGLIATQTYTRIIEAQGLRLEQQKQQEQQVKLEQEQEQNYGNRADDQIQRYQQTLQSLVINDKGETAWLDLDRRGQVASLTRNLLRQLESPDGKPDGLRRAKILKYLYDSRFLIENESEVARGKSQCGQDALSKIMKVDGKSTQEKRSKNPQNDSSTRTLEVLPQFIVDRKLTGQSESKCDIARLVPLRMDFSYASLRGVFLNYAALPFINLSHADLSNAQLRGADLRFANLKNANLKGADLTDAKLDFGNLVNAELRSAKIKNTSFAGALLFYSTVNSEVNINRDPSFRGSLSWELTKQKQSDNSTQQDLKPMPILFCPLDPRMDPERGRTAPVRETGSIAQAGAKCNNRAYSGYRRRNDLISNRNWASGDFVGTTIENFRLNRINFTNANLRGAVFRYVRLNDVDFTGANLDGARFENCMLNNVDFTGASIRQMTFVGSSVERPLFKGSQYVLPIALGDYADNLLRLSGRNMDISSTSNQSPPARLAQRLLAPLLLAPFPLRPSRALIWLVPYSPELLFRSDNRQSIP
jgi:uncharacterized protein YjbI with pentapeptide repeats